MDLDKLDMDDMEKELVLLHSGLIKQLRIKIASGEAVAADFQIAWKILRDNQAPLLKLAAEIEAQEALKDDDGDKVIGVFKFTDPKIAAGA